MLSMALLFAGNETTAALIGDPGRITTAVEEISPQAVFSQLLARFPAMRLADAVHH